MMTTVRSTSTISIPKPSSRRCTRSSSGSRRSRATCPGSSYGHRPETPRAGRSPSRARPADHGALQLLRRRDRRARGRERPDRASRRTASPRCSSPTQVADEGRHLEVLLHRLRDARRRRPRGRGRSAAPARSLLLFQRRLLELVASKDWEAALFAQNVILESLEFAVFHDPRAARRSGDRARCCAASSRTSAGTSASARTSSAAGSRSAPHIRARIGQVQEGARPPRARRARGDGARTSDSIAASTSALGRAYLESVERLGFAE